MTVIIPFFNPGNYLKDAIESIFSQTFDKWNLLLINDASTDNSLSIIQSYLDNEKINLLHNQKNLGQSKSLNIGLSFVNTPFIITLDADDWFPQNTLEVLVGKMENISSKVAVMGGNINIVTQRRNRVKTRIIKGRDFSDQYDFLISNQSVWPRFYRTTALKDVGGWPVDDPWDGRHAEDIRILTRLLENNYQIGWANDTLLNHRRHQHNQTNNLSLYGEVYEWIVRDNLNRWGNKFKPDFIEYENGWKHLKQLIPIR
ncbi:glycosyltransferase family 2 protein [Bacillus coreaensis]